MQQVRVMKAAGFLMATNMVSRILGYLRDVIMFNQFGMNELADAFTAAFRIPDLIYTLLIGGALTSAFIPVFSSYIIKDKQRDAWQVFSIMLSWVMALMVVLVTLAMIFAPQLMAFLVRGFDPEYMPLTIVLTRIMLLQPLFLALAGVSMGVLHSYQNFTAPAVGSMFYNLFIVLGGLFLARPIEHYFPGYGIAGYAVGVVTGALVYFLLQIPALRRTKIRYERNFNVHHEGFVRLIQLMIPLVISLSAQEVSKLITVYLASYLQGGAVAAMNMANKFMNLPVYVFAVNIAIAMFPSLTRQAAQNDMLEFKKSMSLGIRTIAFISIPAAVGLIVLREPIMRLMLEFSAGFTAQDRVYAAQALLFYGFGLVSTSLVTFLLRCFYALQNTVIPVIVSVLSILANLLFAVLLVGPMGHMGLAFAFTLAETLRCVVLFVLLRLRLGQMDLRRIAVSFVKTGLVCVLMGLACWGVAHGLEGVLDMGRKTYQAVQLAAAMGAALVIFFGGTYALKMEEAKLVVDIFKRRLNRKKQADAH